MPSKKFKTSITDIKDHKEYIRGHELSQLMKDKTFTETIFLILSGRMPEPKEIQMLDAMFVAAIDHGPGTASGQVSRIVASAKNSMHTSLAAGILSMGERHGSAIEGAASFFRDNENCESVSVLVKGLKEQKVRIPGFGHPFLPHDYRSDILFELAKELKLYGKYCEFAQNFHKELNKQSSKELALNIDGSMAAILSDMGFAPEIMKGFFIIARMPGLVAHVYEEQMSDVGLRRLPQEEIEYIGT